MSLTFSHSEAVQFPKVGIGGEFFIDIETVGRAPPSKESPNQPGIKSFPSTALDDRQRAAPFCIASYSPRINSVRNAGGNFFDDHQSLVYFLSTSHGNPSAAFSDESIGLQLHCAGY